MKDSLFGITQLIDDSDEEEETTENPEGIFFYLAKCFQTCSYRFLQATFLFQLTIQLLQCI